MKLTHLILAASSAALIVACGNATKSDTSAPAKSAPAAQQDIRVVGSSTVYPFSTKVAQEFKNKTGQNVVVESTGSGGGHKLFCEGIDENTPDVTNSSRRQKKSEFDMCQENGVENIVEVKIGFDGIVVANAIDNADMSMDLDTLYLALAKQVPTSETDCTLIDNPYTRWSEIDSTLPDVRIEVFGPPPTSGTRDAFVEIAMEGGAKLVPCMAALRETDKKAFGTIAHTVREDGKWIDSGENDNALVQTLVNTPTAVGVFGYSFLAQNADKVKGALIGGAEPTFEAIASGDYPVSRSLYFYVKADKAAAKSGLQDFALEFTSDAAAGPGGYLEEIGLVPLPDAQRAKVRADIENMTAYSQ
jgi:phosphate transport system substrate-binding protein